MRQPFLVEIGQEHQTIGAGLRARHIFFQSVHLPSKQIANAVDCASHVHRTSQCQPVICAITKCGNFSSWIDHWGFRKCVNVPEVPRLMLSRPVAMFPVPIAPSMLSPPPALTRTSPS